MATLTLHDVPEEVVARLKQRARAHGRSPNSEVVAALEALEPPAVTPEAESAGVDAAPAAFDREASLARIREVQARFPGSAKAVLQPCDREEAKAELELFARLRSQFKGPPLTSDEIIAGIERDGHPPDYEHFATNQENYS